MIYSVFLALLALSPGETGYNYLKLNVSPIHQFLGQSFLAYDAPLSFFVNPGLPKIPGRLSGNVARYIADIYFGSFGYSLSEDFAFGVFYLNSGKMAKIDREGQYLGEFSTSHLYFLVSKNFLLKNRYRVGVNIKLLYQNIDKYSSLALAFDVGYAKTIGSTSIGLALSNIGYEVKPLDEERVNLPLSFRSGIMHSFSSSFRLGFGLNASPEKTIFSLALMLKLVKNLDIGIGYNSLGRDWKTGQGNDIVKGLNFGGLFSVKGVELAYSYSPTGEFGDIHRVGISYRLK